MKKHIIQEGQTAYKSISRSAKILSCLSDGKNSITEIAQQCELSKPTTSRLLKALEKSNLAIRDPVHHKYYLGPLLSRLVSNPKTTHLNLITLSSPEINRLSEISGETVVLGILIGSQNIRLHMLPSRYNVRVYDDDDGQLTYAQLYGAATQALLSQLSRKDFKAIINTINFDNNSPRSRFEIEEYALELKRIKSQGYVISRGKKIAGALAISVPITNYSFPAVLSVVGIESRLEPKEPEVLPEVIASANRISRKLPELP